MYKYFINHNKQEHSRHWWNWRFILSSEPHNWKKWGIELNSWSGFRFSLGFSSDINDNMWSIDLGLIFFTMLLKFRHQALPFSVDVIGDYEDREINLSISDWTVRLNLWEKEHHWSSSDKRRWRFDVLEFVLGKTAYEKHTIKTETRKVQFPEKDYEVNFEFYNQTWKRKRWFKHRQLSVNMECKEGIPVPGKGENSWDCGDDRRYSHSGPISSVSVEKAIGKFIGGIFETRAKHGSGPDMYVGRLKEIKC